ncbi:hypothetical protein MTR67_010468 [Solanum verrucosum]|uniref:RRM domain-containing protein n=1 Tax=Solanum verrucosum TaxID=315347 RepID=A0AAF0Q637_SOLVR|nr:hypothetical protein MTR67_010468 [Solanum verrucosum]
MVMCFLDIFRFRGFLKLKMQSTYGAPVAFVDFQDTASSTEALSHLQGTILHSSSGEGMRLEYPFINSFGFSEPQPFILFDFFLLLHYNFP